MRAHWEKRVRCIVGEEGCPGALERGQSRLEEVWEQGPCGTALPWLWGACQGSPSLGALDAEEQGTWPPWSSPGRSSWDAVTRIGVRLGTRFQDLVRSAASLKL